MKRESHASAFPDRMFMPPGPLGSANADAAERFSMATFLRNIHGALTLAEMPGIYSAFSLKPSAPSFLEVFMRFTLTPFFFAGHTNSRDSLAKVILRTSLAVAFVTA